MSRSVGPMLVFAGLLASGVSAQDDAVLPPSVEELLRGIDRPASSGQEEPTLPPIRDPLRDAPAVIPGLEGLEDLLQPFAPTPAVHFYRAADPVEVIHDGERRVLQYWDSHLELVRGDEVRQGPKARSVTDFPDGTHVLLDGPALMRVESGLDDRPRRVDLGMVRKLALLHFYEDETIVRLPGGHDLVGRQAIVTVRAWEERTLRVRNSGPAPIQLRGPYLAPEGLTLLSGQEVDLPRLPVAARRPAGDRGELVTGEDGAPIRISAPESIEVLDRAPLVFLRGTGGAPRVAVVGGARMVVRPGATVRMRRAPLGRTDVEGPSGDG